jgi:arylsulfatase A
MRAVRAIIYVSAVLLLHAVGNASWARQPNFLLILADDVGREVLGCYGGTSYQTPNIDRLADGGVRCDHAYVMPVCHPTRTTLLTGQYPFRLGHPDWGSFPRDADSRTLAALLKRAGYATSVAGKWQLGLLKDDCDQPTRMGFDEYCLFGWHEGARYYQPRIWQNGRLRTDVRDRYGPDVTSEFLIDFIERNKDRPFFAFYPMELCHAVTNDLDTPVPFGPNGRYDDFAEMVDKMDVVVGRLVAALDRLGLRASTLILYVGDNGTAARNIIDAKNGSYIYENVVSKMGDREIPGGKATLTDWGTRVPLIINWPGTIDPGKVSEDLIDVSDFLPTLAGLAGAPLPDDLRLDGQLMPPLSPDKSIGRNWVFAEHKGHCFVRNRDWKLYDDGRFYDMTTDPNEARPIRAGKLTGDAAVAQRELRQALDKLNFRPRR